MGSDQKTASKNGRKHYFDNYIEDMEMVKPLLDLDLWKHEYGDEEFKVLLEKLTVEKECNILACYGLAKFFVSAAKMMAFPKTNPK